MRSRRRVLAGWTFGAAALIAAGFVTGSWIRSPQQVAADAAGPGPTTLTATVERRVLTSTVVLRGDVAAARQVDVTPSVSAQSGSAKALVTGIRKKQGETIRPGEVFLEVSGRPLFALPGDKPAYRDLRPGAEGADVAQLQEALKTVGHDPREHDGRLGTGTKAALAAFYASTGYSAPSAGENDQQTLAAARDRIQAAERALEDAKSAGKAGPDPQAQRLTVGRAEQDLNQARKNLTDVESRSGPMLPLGEVVFLPAFPARVGAAKAELGAEVKGALMTLSSGPLLIYGRLNPGQRGLVRTGQQVRITSENLGLSADGTVTSIGELTTDQGTGATGHPVVITPTAPLDPRLAGTNVRLGVAAASTDGEVLVVPVSALFATAGGGAAVIRQAAGGKQDTVPVSPGLSADGLLAVAPAGEALRPGDQVVISEANVPARKTG
ncbi:peptidoglycan-binding protein [Amycolatopsis sp. NPDC059027]|uniref:peptidoglycan-binding protein n=1 Tax=Amycolatopsis sp. NPDC059027 TaxID=3346709 RepID=UPI003671661A